MLPYLLLLLLPSTLALVNTRRVSNFLWVMTFVIFWMFVGLRLEIGPDWGQYQYIHTTLGYQDFWDVMLQVEPLSYTLFWISDRLGFEVYLSNMVAAFIMLLGVFSFARLTPSPWLSIVAATPYFIIVMGMSGIRQSMAAGVVLFILSRWENYSFISRAGYILVAAMFHTSALVNNIFLVIRMNIALRYKIILAVFVLAITLYLGFEVSAYADNVLKYKERYLGGSFLSQSFGSLYHISMVTVPALLGFIMYRRISLYIHSFSLLKFGLYTCLGVFLINFFSSTVASRLTLYLYFVPMMVYPALLAAFEKNGRLMIAFAIILFHVLMIAGWFGLGNHAFAYKPYKNILFDDPS